MATTTTLEQELVKARKRRVEQANAVAACEEIIASSLALPSLKKIAKQRLPKLRSTLSETDALLLELEKALEVPIQTHIESEAPATPLRRAPARSAQ